MNTIHIQHDDEGPIEIVDEAEGKLRSLQFGSPARQSTMFTARPHELALEYTRTMAAGLLFLAAEPKRILVLGLGGGSLPKFFLYHFPDCHIDVAEIRPAIVDVATRFFDLPTSDDHLHVHLEDGYDFLLRTSPASYDLILIDLHDANGMAPAVDEEGFSESCRLALRAEGDAVYNLWFGVRPQQETHLRRRLEKTFDHLLRLPIAGKRNCVAYGLNGPIAAASSMTQRATMGESNLGLALPQVLEELRKRHPRAFAP